MSGWSKTKIAVAIVAGAAALLFLVTSVAVVGQVLSGRPSARTAREAEAQAARAKRADEEAIENAQESVRAFLGEPEAEFSESEIVSQAGLDLVALAGEEGRRFLVYRDNGQIVLAFLGYGRPGKGVKPVTERSAEKAARAFAEKQGIEIAVTDPVVRLVTKDVPEPVFSVVWQGERVVDDTVRRHEFYVERDTGRIVMFSDNDVGAVDVATPVKRAQAAKIAGGDESTEATLLRVTDSGSPLLVWRVDLADGQTRYVDAETGSLLAGSSDWR